MSWSFLKYLGQDPPKFGSRPLLPPGSLKKKGEKTGPGLGRPPPRNTYWKLPGVPED